MDIPQCCQACDLHSGCRVLSEPRFRSAAWEAQAFWTRKELSYEVVHTSNKGHKSWGQQHVLQIGPHRCWQNREFLCYLGTRKFCTPIHTWCTSFALQTINQVFVFYDPVSKTGHFSEVRVFSVSPEQPPLCRVWVSGVLKHPPAAAEALVQRSPPHAARRHPAAQEHCSVAGRLHPRAPPWHPPVFCFRASSVGSS